MTATPCESGRAVNRRREQGFTLLEMLVVMVIIPLIIGGVAEALIVTFQSQSATSNRLSDTVNAQLTSDYLIRDIQGASYVTTYDNSSGAAFAFNAPQVCKPTNAGTLQVAVFHLATTGGAALDVAYWLDSSGSSTEIDRYSCTLHTADDLFTSTTPVLTAVATAPPGTATGSPGEVISATTDIYPAQFQGGASLGWVPTGAFTHSSGIISNLSAASTINVASVAGFSVGSDASGICAASSSRSSASGCANPPSLTVETTLGPAQVTCTGFTMPTALSPTTPMAFTGCSSVSNGTVTQNSDVTQSTVSGVQISVVEPSSSYKFNLVGVPRAGAPQSKGLGSNAPTLLTLGGSGISPINGGGASNCPDGARANICIGTGGVIVDAGGTVFCNGAGPHSYIHFESGSGSVDTVANPGSSNCNTVQVGPTTGIDDPIKNNLPNHGCLIQSFVNSLPVGTVTAGVSTPGLYSGGLQPSGQLEPGLYVLESGVGAITGEKAYSPSDPYFKPTNSAPYFSSSASPDTGAGVLLYVPGPGPYPSSQNCFTSNAAGLKGPGGTAQTIGGLLTPTIPALAPMDATQSADYLGGNTTLGSVLLWQDRTNTNPMSLTGVTGNGLFYAPDSTFTLSGSGSLTTGSMYIGGVTMGGSNTLILNWT